MDQKGKMQLQILRRLSFVGQLGFSVAVPLLLCLLVCWQLTSRRIAGQWVYLPGFFFGLGGSAAGLVRLYRSVTREEEKERGERPAAFNRHE